MADMHIALKDDDTIKKIYKLLSQSEQESVNQYAATAQEFRRTDFALNGIPEHLRENTEGKRISDPEEQKKRVEDFIVEFTKQDVKDAFKKLIEAKLLDEKPGSEKATPFIAAGLAELKDYMTNEKKYRISSFKEQKREQDEAKIKDVEFNIVRHDGLTRYLELLAKAAGDKNPQAWAIEQQNALLMEAKKTAFKEFDAMTASWPKINGLAPKNEEEMKAAVAARNTTLDKALVTFDAAMQKKMDALAEEIKTLANGKQDPAERDSLLKERNNLENHRAKRHEKKQAMHEFGGIDIASAVGNVKLAFANEGPPAEGGPNTRYDAGMVAAKKNVVG